jgi:hypothetical protein
VDANVSRVTVEPPGKIIGPIAITHERNMANEVTCDAPGIPRSILEYPNVFAVASWTPCHDFDLA